MKLFGSKINGEDYLNIEPKFDFRNYFDGELKAWGIVQNRQGKIINRFDMKMLGSWQGNEGKLEEQFYYYDATPQEQKAWSISIDEQGQISARGDHIVGEAKFASFGNAVNWQYTMTVPVGETTYDIAFDDWMWLMNDGSVMNRSYMRKFGIQVAEISIFIQKLK